MTYDWDWRATERSHRRALELGPGLSFVHGNYSFLLACVGRFDEALEQARRAERLDPLSLVASQQVGLILYLARRYDESIAQLEKSVELNPYYWLTYQRLAQVLLATGDFERGIKIMKRGIELAGPDTLRSGKHTLGSLFARSGRRPEALEILNRLLEQEKTTYVPPTDIAQIHTALGNNDDAFEWLEKAVEARDADFFMLRVWPVWDPLREDPRFDDLLRQMGFPAT
ncbi:MAG: tetratricopeptide repeat protein [Thermoanaerobaculales bacterium]